MTNPPDPTPNPAWRTTGTNANGAPLLGDSRDLFRPRTGDIPARPGVYKWRDGEGRVIYVGKAKSLRQRLTNYFQPLSQLHPRTQTMVLTARSLEWTVVGTELEALTLEYTWIKEFDPRFNVVFRDDKTYPYLAASIEEPVPRVWITRSRKRRGTRYFGPYAKVWELRRSLDALLRAYPVRTCSDSVFRRARASGRPCLLASIGKCSAPCVSRIDPADHRAMVATLVGVLNGNLSHGYLAQLAHEMERASADLDFERAARLRDEITMLRTVIEKNAVTFDSDVDADVFGFASDELEASVHAFFVRAGTIRGERNWSVERVEDISDEDLMHDMLWQVYTDISADDARNPDSSILVTERRDAVAATQKATAVDGVERAKATRERNQIQGQTGRADLMAPISPIPREVIVPIQPSRTGELEAWLSDLRHGSVTVRVASRGDKKALMDRAHENAGQALQRSKLSRISDLGARTEAMNQVAAALNLDHAPLRIECYDISNATDGSYQVASMVVFEDAIAKPSLYRRFEIHGRNGEGRLDDLDALYETLSRRFRHGNVAGDTGESTDGVASAQRHRFAYKPNLVVVDGARPQARAAAQAIHDRGVDDVAVCGLSKRLEEVWLPDEDYPLILPRQSQGLYLLQRLRDESHRFAITYHRNVRRRGSLRSALDGIDGIGPGMQRRLLKAFGSVRAIRAASVEELLAVDGIGRSRAEAIHQALAASAPDGDGTPSVRKKTIAEKTIGEKTIGGAVSAGKAPSTREGSTMEETREAT